MAKNTVTRKNALVIAFNALNRVNSEGLWEDIVEKFDDPKPTYDDTVHTLNAMLEQIAKPRATVVSKARKGNEALAKWVYDHAGDVVTTKDVVNMGNVNIMTTQKASAVLRVACELGLFTKGDGKQVSYAKVYGGDVEG